jgi:hypothetical protein
MNLTKNNRRNKMKKNLIFKLCFIVGIFLIILTACDLGTKQWANITFSLEGPTLEGRATQEGRSSSSRYIHPDAESIEFKLYTGNRLLIETHVDASTKNTDGQVLIRLEKVPLNDPNLRAEIEVRGNQTGSNDPSLLGQNSIHLGRIGLGYTKLTLGVKPVEKDLKTATYESGDNGTNLTYTAGDISKVWKIKMLNQKGLYTISGDYNSANIYLYDSDGKNYQNSLFIGGEEGPRTLVFYHPEDKASTYYAYFESKEWGGLPEGGKLEQDILITIKEDGSFIEILDGYVEYLGGGNNADEKKSLTIYNPYPFTLNLTNTIENADEYPDSQDKFTFEGFPDVLLPGKSEEFTVNFHDPDFDSTTYSVKSTISAPGLKDFVLHFTGTSSGT